MGSKMKTKSVMFRQGDVLVAAVACALPREVERVARDAGRIVLAYGEVTGHAHAIHSSGATLWECADGARYLEVKRAVQLLHEEHATIKVPAGLYRVVRQREYSPEAIRFVAD
ncbi:MAG TPA: hypothetical protein VGF94_13185 [Kofleriaceae bacterium]|jgi:hypothetical protein